MNTAYTLVYLILLPFIFILHPFKIIGRENISEGAAIVCANHSNITDPLLIAFGFKLKNKLHFMAKVELFGIPVIGWALKKSGVFPVNRSGSDISAIRTSMEYLKKGEKIMIFPEGTRVSSDDAVAAKTGAIRMASKLNVPIVPVNVPREKPPFRRITITIGEPYMLPKLSNSEFADESDRLMEKINELGMST